MVAELIARGEEMTFVAWLIERCNNLIRARKVSNKEDLLCGGI